MSKNFYQQACGMSEQQIVEQYVNSLTTQLSGLEMTAMGVLSDAQEMLAAGYDDNAVRQQINIAKYLLGCLMDQRQNA